MSMNRIDRLLGYLLVFQSRRVARAQDLATRFEVSERTVYRDIEALYEVGVPLVGMPGEGYQLMPGYYLPPVMFDEDEAKALFLAIAMFTGLTTTGPTHNAARSVLDKIRVILPKITLVEVEALQAMLGFYHVNRPPLELDHPIFLQIQRAIRATRVLRITYHAQHDNQVTEREVEPLKLVYLDDVWVLSAYCRLREGQRAFRLDRIDGIKLAQETFVPRPMNKEQSASGEKVSILVKAEAVRWVRESQHFAHIAERELATGDLLMDYQLRDQLKFTSWLLQWGEYVEVIAPATLREAMMQRVKAMARQYQVGT